MAARKKTTKKKAKKKAGKRGGARAGAGRPSYEPDDDTRELVEILAGHGITHDQIAVVLKVSVDTLRKYYAEELDRGKCSAAAEVIKTLFMMATSGNCPAATFFWLKTQLGWREVVRVEEKTVYAAEELTDDELAEIIARRARGRRGTDTPAIGPAVAR